MMSERLNVQPKDLAEPIMSSDNKPVRKYIENNFIFLLNIY